MCIYNRNRIHTFTVLLYITNNIHTYNIYFLFCKAHLSTAYTQQHKEQKKKKKKIIINNKKAHAINLFINNHKHKHKHVFSIIHSFINFRYIFLHEKEHKPNQIICNIGWCYKYINILYNLTRLCTERLLHKLFFFFV